MMTSLKTFFFASLLVALQALAANCHGAEDAFKPDYTTLVNALFDKAACCKISGTVGWEDETHEVDFSTKDPRSLEKIKLLLLSEKAHYAVNQYLQGYSGSVSNLYLTWFDEFGKKTNELDLINGSEAVFNRKHLFVTPYVKVLMRLALFVSPEIFKNKKLSIPP